MILLQAKKMDDNHEIKENKTAAFAEFKLKIPDLGVDVELELVTDSSDLEIKLFEFNMQEK
jgi:hypothetical protein